MWPNPQFPADMVKFTEEILNEKLYFSVQCLVPFSFFPALGLHRNFNQLKLFQVLKFIHIGHVQITFCGHCIVVRVWWQSMINISCFIHVFEETPLSFTMHSVRLMDCILCQKARYNILIRQNKIYLLGYKIYKTYEIRWFIMVLNQSKL